MEKEGKTVSIIVPVYQVREYLDVCVQSVLAQTYTDLEIILVDDGSTDGSEKICDRYAETDERVRVVHQKNKGLSGARNEGLKLAKGEYIAFVDADDKVSPFFIELLYELAEKYHARIAVCSYEKGRELSGKIKRKKAYVVGSDKMLREWHGKRKKLETVVWNKLYHRSIFEVEKGNVFPEGKLHEDVYVSHLFVQRAGRVAITGEKLYLYRTRTGSIKKSPVTEERVDQNLDAQRARLAFFEKEGMHGSCRRLKWGFGLHVMMYRWRLLRQQLCK